MYSDQEIDRKISELRDAVGHIAQAQADQIKRVEDAVAAQARLLRAFLTNTKLPEDEENAALDRLDAYLRALGGK